MRPLDGPNSTREILTSPLPTICWAQTKLSLISIFKRGCCVIWAISASHQASKQTCIWESHYSRVEGHFGIENIVAVLQQHFYWLKLRHDVSKYIMSCMACAIAKLAIKKQGMYTPLPIPDKPWESISMDYMSGLPSTKKGNDYVFVVVDRFSKMAILVVCKKSITTEATTKLFFERVWVHFGVPQKYINMQGLCNQIHA
jgi:hypothetical protein